MKRVPGQIIRLGAVFIVLIVILVILRTFLKPPEFGKFGHYRPQALEKNENKPIYFAGSQKCAECHETEFEMLSKSNHYPLSCEVCHGAGNEHASSGGENAIEIPRKREHCLRCHQYLGARPTGFPQIDPYIHNPPEQCISCHSPHNPGPPVPPTECRVCHAEIARMKAISPHARLKCETCHTPPKEHRVDPQRVKPSKPADREFCGNCHSRTSSSPSNIPRIDMRNHYTKYLCWECHYPHYPESK